MLTRGSLRSRAAHHDNMAPNLQCPRRPVAAAACRGGRPTAVTVLAFKPNDTTPQPTAGGVTSPATQPMAAPLSSPSPPPVVRSATALLQELAQLGQAAATPGSGVVNSYGKPYTKSELEALKHCLDHLAVCKTGGAAAAAGPAALRDTLMSVIKAGAIRKEKSLAMIEGAMVVLELMQRSANPAMVKQGDAMSEADMLARWQLVVGADVGAVQYIPAVEELQVPPSGASFTLDTDLDLLLTAFSGPAAWLAPGHLSYTVRSVRLEMRMPKAWRRAAAWLAWRRAGGGEGSAGGPDYGDALPTSATCHVQPGRWPATDVGLPFFPNNELLTICCDGEVAAVRSKLGGLIMLLTCDVRERAKAAGQWRHKPVNK